MGGAMGSFRDRPFEQRIGGMGDEAERVFEQSYEQKWVRFGLNRPPINMTYLPAFIRFTPDYLTAKGLVEVQGFGKDRTAKFKSAKMASLDQWAEKFRVDFFLWDSVERRFGWVRYDELSTAIFLHAESRTFPNDGNAYWALNVGDIPVVDRWVPFGERLGADR